MAARSWARRAFTTTAVAAVGLLALAVPASAHVPDAKAGCDQKTEKAWLKVDATQYAVTEKDATPNSVKVVEVVDGKDKVILDAKFGAEFHQSWDTFDPTVAHTFKVSIVAADDQKYSKDFVRKTEACVKKQTPPSSSTPPPAPPANNPPAPQPAAAPAAVGATGQLASTGVSIAIPIAIGALLLVGGAGLLLLMRRRGKA
jgi:LPXTG-motif cell wall-anchored protein